MPPTLAARSRSPGMMYGSGTRPVGFQLIPGPRRLLTFHGMRREMEVINLEVRGAPPAESLCVPWGGMGATPKEEQGDAEFWRGDPPCSASSQVTARLGAPGMAKPRENRKKTNPKVLSSHKMRGGKSHPTPHPPHLRLPPASIRESSGSWDVRRGLHMEGLAGVGEGGGASPLNSQLTADQSN